MIERVGIDVVEVDRIAQAMKREGFVERILTPAERPLAANAKRVAGRWAAKEALAKALDRKVGWHEVEVLNDPEGRPVLWVAPKWLNSRTHRVHLSISHERNLAAAVVVLERVGS